jgi:N-acetylglucosaminyldiphosphoundecaprenol N-acetyl-beta-D-mannosaminyltransferase
MTFIALILVKVITFLRQCILYVMKINIFGMWVESFDISAIAKQVTSQAAKGENLMVVTPNVDHFLRWQKNAEFRKLYEMADYRLIDGMPILLLARLLSKGVSERITGVDFSIRVVSEAHALQLPIALIGGSENASQLARNNLLRSFPTLDIFYSATPSTSDLADPVYLTNLSKELARKEQKIVLLCLGSPKQEQLYFNLNSITSLTGAYLCVGGTIDFFANLVKRAPGFIQKLGFEWFYRFMQEPTRLFRRYFVSSFFFLPFLIKAIFQSFSAKFRKAK